MSWSRVKKARSQYSGRMRSETLLTGEVSKLKHRIIRVVDTGDDVGSAESDLLSLGDVVGGVLVESHLSNPFYRCQFFTNPFRAVEDIEVEGEFLLFSDELNSKVPLRESSSFDGTFQAKKSEKSARPIRSPHD